MSRAHEYEFQGKVNIRDNMQKCISNYSCGVSKRFCGKIHYASLSARKYTIPAVESFDISVVFLVLCRFNAEISVFLSETKQWKCPHLKKKKGHVCFGKHKELLLWYEYAGFFRVSNACKTGRNVENEETIFFLSFQADHFLVQCSYPRYFYASEMLVQNPGSPQR